jgi:predicted NAD/FAD-dependent oxidoreductase
MTTTKPWSSLVRMQSVLTLLLLLLTTAGFSQNNKGKDFWAAQTPNPTGVVRFDTARVAIVVSNISNTMPANIVIEKQNASKTTVTGTVAPGSVKEFFFASENKNIQNTAKYTDNVYHITSDRDVVVYDFNPYYNVVSNDASLLLPVPALGKKYRVGSYVNSLGNTSKSLYAVIAVENGTSITVYDRDNTAIETINLNRGEYYQRLQGTLNPNAVSNDMTGWYIESNKPLSAFSGSHQTSVGNTTASGDHLIEQLFPIEALSKSYAISPTNSRPIAGTIKVGDLFRFVATEDNTVLNTSVDLPATLYATTPVGTTIPFSNVTIGAASGITLMKGQFLELTTNVPHIISGNHAFYAFQYLTSQNQSITAPNPSGVGTVTVLAGTGDPSMFNVPIVDQYQFNYNFVTPSSYAFNFINITAPVGANFNLDGSVVANFNWTSVGTYNGIAYQTAAYAISVGNHKIVSDQKFGITASGFGNQASYAYVGGSGLEPINAGCITGGPYQVISCNPITENIQLNGHPSCEDGGTPGILWSSEDGVIFSDPTIANPTATVHGYGTFHVTMTVTCGGNSIKCTSELTVIEQLSGCNMTIVPPPSIVVSTDPGSPYATNVNIGTATYTSTAQASLSNDAPNQYPIGVTTVTWTVTDIFGRSKSGSHTVTVVAGPPTITPPPAITVTADPSSNVAANVALGTAVYGVAVNPATLTNDAPNVFPIGNTTVTWTVQDGLGQTASGTQIVTVIKATRPPTIVAPPTVTVIAGYNGFATNVDLRSNGNESYTAEVNPATVTNAGVLTQYPIGSTNVTWTVTDGLGRTASDVQQVVVIAPRPVIAPPADITVSNDNGLTYSSNVVLVDPVFSAVGPYTLTNDAPASGQFPIGSTVVTWTLTDAYGNTLTTSNTVTVVSAPPTIVAPPTITVTAGYNGFGSVASLGTPTTTVSVNPATVTNAGTLAQYPIGSTNVTWTVTDGLGRTASDIQQVVVVAPRPVIAPPADITISNDPGVTYSSNVVLVDPVFSAVGPYTLTNDASASGQFPIGTTVVTWTLTDAYGNIITTTNNVTVVSAPPTIVAPAPITVTATYSGYAVVPNLGTPTTTVSVNPSTVSNAGTLPSYKIGTTDITWIVTDGLGRTASDVQKVIVLAPLPIMTPPADVTVNNDPGKTDATGVNIGFPFLQLVGPGTIKNDAPANGQWPLGTTTITWTATDFYGNVLKVTQKITVVSAPPTIVAPAPITVTAGYNGSASVPNLGTPTTTVSVNPATVTKTGTLAQYPIGSTSITWTVTDGIGRTASDVQKVIVVVPQPTIAPPADVTVSNDPGKTYATGVSTGTPAVQAVGPYTLTNDAPANGQWPLGTTIITWTLTDAYGNVVKTTQKVTVVSAPPTITPPANITVTAAAGQTSASIASIGTATYTVSVDPAILTNSGNASGVYAVGTTTVTWTVKDGLGRTASGTQTITVNPSAACSYVTTITSIPTDVTPTGGNPKNLYIGYGAQSTKLQVNVPNTGGPYTFQWTGTKLSSNTSAAPIFTPGTAAGNYSFTVTVKNASGCTSTATISICVRDVRSLDKNGNWDGKKVIVCHLPPGNIPNVQYIDVSINAVPTHVPNHGGDGLGNTCEQPSCTSPYARGTAPVVATFGVSLYPNPTANQFSLTVKSDDKYTDINIRIIDAFGRTVEVFKSVTVGRTVLFGDKYANGTYYAEVVQGRDKKMIPMVKAK